MTRRLFICLAVTATLAAGCGDGEDSAEPTTTTASTVAIKPGFDPANPQAALVPIPGFTYRNMTRAEDSAMRQAFEGEPAAVRAAYKGFTGRVGQAR